MNNPMMLIHAVKNGRNPMPMIQQMAQSSPRMAQAVQMLWGKNEAQLQQMAHNIAREFGIDINALMRTMGIK